MATINCPTTLECPALPRVTLSQAVIDLMESIALQESALSHILCAESQKMKTALAMNEIDLCKLLEVNDSVPGQSFSLPLWLAMVGRISEHPDNRRYQNFPNLHKLATAK